MMKRKNLIDTINSTKKEKVSPTENEILERIIFYLLEHSKGIDDFVSTCKLMGLKQNTMLNMLKVIVDNSNADGGIAYVSFH